VLNFRGVAVINEGVLDLRQFPADQIDVQRSFESANDTDVRVIDWGNVRLLVTAQQSKYLLSRLQNALQTGVDSLTAEVPGGTIPPPPGGDYANRAVGSPSLGTIGASIPRNVANAIAAKGLANLTFDDAVNLKKWLDVGINQFHRRRQAPAGQPAERQMETAGNVM
jgi:hypothetical protein